MLTLLGYGVLAVVVAVALFLIAAYLLPAGEQIAPPVRDEPLWDLPAGRRLTYDDVTTVRLPVALRGYRFAETDALLDRLADELAARDEEIARLRRHVPAQLRETEERWTGDETAVADVQGTEDDDSGGAGAEGSDDALPSPPGADDAFDVQPDRRDRGRDS